MKNFIIQVFSHYAKEKRECLNLNFSPVPPVFPPHPKLLILLVSMRAAFQFPPHKKRVVFWGLRRDNWAYSSPSVAASINHYEGDPCSERLNHYESLLVVARKLPPRLPVRPVTRFLYGGRPPSFMAHNWARKEDCAQKEKSAKGRQMTDI